MNELEFYKPKRYSVLTKYADLLKLHINDVDAYIYTQPWPDIKLIKQEGLLWDTPKEAYDERLVGILVENTKICAAIAAKEPYWKSMHEWAKQVNFLLSLEMRDGTVCNSDDYNRLEVWGEPCLRTYTYRTLGIDGAYLMSLWHENNYVGGIHRSISGEGGIIHQKIFQQGKFFYIIIVEEFFEY